MLIHKPSSLSWTEAAGIPEAWITAMQALHVVGCFRRGDSVLFHAGASSVSLAGIQLARAAGASAVYVTAGTAAKVDFCRDRAGATRGFNYRTEDWVAGIMEATGGRGVDVIVDFVGGNYAQKNFEAAAVDARIVQLASLAGSILPAGLDIGLLVHKRIRWEGSSLRSRDLPYQARLRDAFVLNALPRFADGTLTVFVERVFSWKDIQDAHALMEANVSMGKIICVVD